MRFAILLLLLAVPARADDVLIDIATVAPSVKLDLRYATADNFMKKKLYPVARCLLHREVAVALADVARDLAARHLGLKLWDCYRPLSIQKKFWALLPDERYVADPQKGSRHNRGAAVDVTLVDEKGHELVMPTPFDEFSPRAHRDFTGASPAAANNRSLLEAAMARRGFTGLPTEWWHFDFRGWERWPVADQPLTPSRPDGDAP
jgi:D-alanyl-D-alanine dipeptidase